MEAELEFRVMGTNAHVVVVAPGAAVARAHAEDARARLEQLERRWSRFLPDSEVSRLNDASGAPVVVSADTRGLVTRAVDGWRRTHGRFDPTVVDALVAQGYDRDFASIDQAAPAPVDVHGAPGCGGIDVDDLVGAVRLPRGVHFDAGGIGKGFAADIVVEELVAAGVDGACVNVGGDLRVAGRAPGDSGWVVDLEHPITGASVAYTQLRAGAVVSTWRTKRAWGPPDARRHHLIDPATGAPATSGLAGVVVVTGRAWWGEVLAKAAFVDGLERGTALLEEHGASGYLVDDDGVVHTAGHVEEFVA
jgi:thiamine biosynthesis lipoprotein